MNLNEKLKPKYHKNWTPRSENSAGKILVERQIAEADRQIDAFFCELYELTGKEIRIVEEASKK